MPEIPKTAKMTYSPDDVMQLVLADARAHGVDVGEARPLMTMRSEGDQRETWKVPVFEGFEVEIQLHLQRKKP